MPKSDACFLCGLYIELENLQNFTVLTNWALKFRPSSCIMSFIPVNIRREKVWRAKAFPKGAIFDYVYC